MSLDCKYISDLFDLKNQVVVLTGGLGRLGTEFAEALVKANARVVIFDLSTKLNSRLHKLSQNSSLLSLKVDITNEDNVLRGLQKVESVWSSPTILINNAGWKASPSDSKEAGLPFENYSVPLWEKVFRVNTTGAMICSKIIGGNMIRKRKSGVIINISSIYGIVAPNQKIYSYKEKKYHKKFMKDASYSASKAALIAITRDLAIQWAPHNIRVVALALGGVLNESNDQEFIQNYSAHVPIGRMAKPNEYNGALVFLASEASSYMTGSTTIIDGGWTSW